MIYSVRGGDKVKISVKIDKVQNDPNSALKAFASVTLDGMFAVHGLRVMESAKGRFVNMPSNSYKDKNGDTKYSDVFHAITKPARDAVSAAVLNAYDRYVSQTQSTEIEIEQSDADEPEPEPEITM